MSRVILGPQGEVLIVRESKEERELRDLQRDVTSLEQQKKFLAKDEFEKRMKKLRTRMAALR